MNDVVKAAAEELVARLGAAATEWVQNRITLLKAAGDMRAADEAYQLLTAVERVLAQRCP